MKFYINEKPLKVKEFSIDIESIGLYTNLCFGDSSCLDRGAWMKKWDIYGNSVITGHLFTLFPLRNGVFSKLDKVEVGDVIILYIDSEEYSYKVIDHFVVKPKDIQIESQEFAHFLTIYTCYPLLTANMRYVVRAELME